MLYIQYFEQRKETLRQILINTR